MINLLIGKNVALTGPGEVTKDISPYPSPHGKLCFYDFPGSNEEISYYSGNVLSLAKEMDQSCVLFTSTIKTNIRYCKLLQALKRPFVALLTQTDLIKWTKEEIVKVKQQTDNLLKENECYKGCFAVSCEAKGELNDTKPFIQFLLSIQDQKFPKSNNLISITQPLNNLNGPIVVPSIT